MIFKYRLPYWIVARNPVYCRPPSDSNLTNKEFPVLEIAKLPKFPLSFEIWSGVEYGDPLTIYDGSNDLSTEIEKLSGNLGSFSISSTGNSLFVKFESDASSYNNIGFFATINYEHIIFINFDRYKLL